MTDLLRPAVVDRRRFAGALGLAAVALPAVPAVVVKGVRSGPTTTAAPAHPLDVEMLQTASSLELVLVAAYEAALQIKEIAANGLVSQFFQLTRGHHDQHRANCDAHTRSLGAKVQTAPDGRYQGVLDSGKSSIHDLGGAVDMLTTFETAVADTYLGSIGTLSDHSAKSLAARTMGVESQHLAFLRLLRSAIDAGAASSISQFPVQVPQSVVAGALREVFGATDQASPPDEGAVH